jgi:hypothetical protein
MIEVRPPERQPLLKPHLDAMNRLADKRLSRDDPVEKAPTCPTKVDGF